MIPIKITFHSSTFTAFGWEHYLTVLYSDGHETTTWYHIFDKRQSYFTQLYFILY